MIFFFHETGNKCDEFGKNMNDFFHETANKCDEFGKNMNDFFHETGNKCNEFGKNMNDVFLNFGSRIVYFCINLDGIFLRNAVLCVAATIKMTSVIGGPLIMAITMIADAATNSTAATDYLSDCPMNGALTIPRGSKLNKKGVNYDRYQSVACYILRKIFGR